MSFRSQTGRKGTGKRPKVIHDKKNKEKKKRSTPKYLREETPQSSSKEITERVLSGISRLGNQIFALSPFSQYFDDWLLNLRQVISEFESNPVIKVDEKFQKERSQIFLDVEAALAENRLNESNLTEEAKALSDNNHKIVEADKQYSENTRDLSNKRNSEIQRLSNKIRELEDYFVAQQNIKVGFFKFKEKRIAQEKLAQTTQDLTAAKTELEVTMQKFTVEQEKLHDSYEKRKQELAETSDRLHKELEKLETDPSTTARETACNAISEAINCLQKRTP